YGSPHHSRSQSVKAGRSRATSQLLGLPQQRARVASMPNTGVEEEYYRLRHFRKGVVNRGDSLRSRRSRSNTSVASSASSTEAGTRASAPCSLASSRDSSAGLSTYRVLVLGAPGVGKSSLVGQFMTSEYLHAYDTSIDDESGERSVCVLLAGEESEITFLDAPPDHAVTDGCAHGYCVVYSTAERSSFAEAEKRLQALWAAGHTARRAVIL
ncbi:GTP-binding protein RAD, partial [Operophtera brumata]